MAQKTILRAGKFSLDDPAIYAKFTVKILMDDLTVDQIKALNESSGVFINE